MIAGHSSFSLITHAAKPNGDEAAALARYRKGAGHPLGRLLSFFPDLLRARRTPTARLEQPRHQHRDHPKSRLAPSLRTRFPCGRCFHHSERLGTDGIDCTSRRLSRIGVGRMVSLTLLSSLSNVLGRSSGLFGFAFRRAPRTSRRSNHSEPARSAIRGYPDELLLPESSLVVFRHAHPVLPNFSPAFLGSTKTGTSHVSLNSVCGWLLCALLDAFRLSAERNADTRRFCHLPATRIRFGYGSGNVAQQVDRTGRKLLPRRRGIGDRIALLSRGAPALQQWLRLHFRRPRHWRLLPSCNHRRGRNHYTIQGSG